MKVKAVKERVERIRAMSGDDEAAHSEEDALYTAVLRAIATGRAEDPKAMAKEALKTKGIEFARWCA